MEINKEVKLVGFWVSPFSLRVEWALKLKGVEYEFIEEDIYNKSPLLLDLNPVHKKIPVLIHGEKAIVESLVILEYIDETWKQFPLLPIDPYEKAMARFWAKLGEEKLFVNIWTALLFQGDERETALKLAKEILEKIEGEIKGREIFFGGVSIGYLDIALGWISYWLPSLEEVWCMKIVDPVQFPNTAVWMENFLNHPIVKNKPPPRDDMVVYFQWQKQEIAAQMPTIGPGGAPDIINILSPPKYVKDVYMPKDSRV